MLQNPRRQLLAVPLDTRSTTAASLIGALLVLVLAAWLLGSFRDQRHEARNNEFRLNAWNEQLLTATPAALERDRLNQQRTELQDRFALVSAQLPSTNVEAGALERIIEAAAEAGVELTALREVGQKYNDGSVVVWGYEIGAQGPLDRLTDFVTRLEEEKFPAAYVRDPILSVQPDGSYVLAGDLDIYGSTLSSSALTAGDPLAQGDLGAQLRAEAAAAMARGDYELALSALLRLAAIEPNAPDINALLYDAYVAYGTSLLARGLFDQARQQFEAALAINPNGQEAMAGLVAAAQGQTPTPGGVVVIGGTLTPTAAVATVGPPATSYVPPTPVSVATSTYPPPPIKEPSPPTVRPPATSTVANPGPSRTPIPTVTLAPSQTASPTASPTVDPNFTPSVTPTTSPVVTPTPALPFGPLSPFYLPNCGLTQVKGTIRDGTTNAPLNGVTVRVWWDGAGPTQVYSLPTGQDPTRGPGEWDVVLADYPKAGQWYVAVINRDTGAVLSPVQTVLTDTNPCGPTGSGHQVVIQDFVRVGSGPGIPGATLTPSRTPTVTTTVTATSTVTPTPTPQPLIYYKDEDPDLVIPDGPNGIAASTLDVVSNATIRELKVFINIQHQDVGDLRITLVHPDGTRVMIKDAGQNAGQTSIRTTFIVNGMAGKPAGGQWTLEVVDNYEARTGTLLSWQIEVYP